MSSMLYAEEEARAVARYTKADQALSRFKQENQDLLLLLAALMEERSAAIDAVEKLARHRKESVGPCTLRSRSWKVNVEEVLKKLGDEEFVRVGGRITREHAMSIDAYRKAEAEGVFRKEDAGKFLIGSCTFSVPEKGVLP